MFQNYFVNSLWRSTHGYQNTEFVMYCLPDELYKQHWRIYNVVLYEKEFKVLYYERHKTCPLKEMGIVSLGFQLIQYSLQKGIASLWLSRRLAISFATVPCYITMGMLSVCHSYVTPSPRTQPLLIIPFLYGNFKT